MTPIPAIDLKNGKVVRLLQGNFDEEKIYFDSPHKAAACFENDGAERLHVVDLEGALSGNPKNLDSIEKIVRTVRIPIQVGGGIRDLKIIEHYLSMGISWVVLGTKACLDSGFLQEVLFEWKDKIIISIDALDGWVATDGWTRVTEHQAVDLAKRVELLGGKTVLYTDISRDGALLGPNLSQINYLSTSIAMNVLASGGMSSLKDLEDLVALKRANIQGVIIGRALYEKKFNIKEAIQACSPRE